MPFFNSVGFQLPERKGIADFLQEVTSPKDQGALDEKSACSPTGVQSRSTTCADFSALLICRAILEVRIRSLCVLLRISLAPQRSAWDWLVTAVA
jgi:hypothetical protein